MARIQVPVSAGELVDADGRCVFGATVEVVDEEAGRTATYTIVGPTEADVGAGRLSAESPVAQALLGAAPGDVVAVPTPSGERRLRIERLG